jgi:hypothetical protein
MCFLFLLLYIVDEASILIMVLQLMLEWLLALICYERKMPLVVTAN